jgi:hypothetical protein
MIRASNLFVGALALVAGLSSTRCVSDTATTPIAEDGGATMLAEVTPAKSLLLQ